jgi:mRNA-degrading endonuclease RelE of RelBE toxin-antitoxin system
VSYSFVLSKRAERKLAKLPKNVARPIASKIRWLAENAEAIRHDRLKGFDEYSLHSGQYRIPYSLDHEKRMVIIEDIDQHDAAYRRLKR